MVSPVDFLVNDARIRQPTAPGRVDPADSTIGTGLQVDDATLTEISNPLQIGTAQTVQELGQLEQFDFLLGQAETSLELTNSIIQEAAESDPDDLSRVEQRFQERVDEIDTLNQEIAVARDAVDRITPDLLAQEASLNVGLNQDPSETLFPDIDLAFQSTLDDSDTAAAQISDNLTAIETSRDILGIFQAGLDSNVRGLTETRVENQITSENEAFLRSQEVRNQIQESAQQSLAGQANVDPSSQLFLY
ncbi:MAG: hypothetical protein R3208_00645 [Ketobacteraceae bacterium]|nr:hypothetical protein [Ketobacteraceae bacterium]